MKKSDLKTGMRVKLKNGTILVVLLNTESGDILVRDFSWVDLKGYSEDLYRQWDKRLDIVEVYTQGSICDIIDIKDIGNLLWQRKEETPIVTLDGVEYSESTLRSLIKKATGND